LADRESLVVSRGEVQSSLKVSGGEILFAYLQS